MPLSKNRIYVFSRDHGADGYYWRGSSYPMERLDSDILPIADSFQSVDKYAFYKGEYFYNIEPKKLEDIRFLAVTRYELSFKNAGDKRQYFKATGILLSVEELIHALINNKGDAVSLFEYVFIFLSELSRSTDTTTTVKFSIFADEFFNRCNIHKIKIERANPNYFKTLKNSFSPVHSGNASDTENDPAPLRIAICNKASPSVCAKKLIVEIARIFESTQNKDEFINELARLKAISFAPFKVADDAYRIIIAPEERLPNGIKQGFYMCESSLNGEDEMYDSLLGSEYTVSTPVPQHKSDEDIYQSDVKMALDATQPPICEQSENKSKKRRVVSILVFLRKHTLAAVILLSCLFCLLSLFKITDIAIELTEVKLMLTDIDSSITKGAPAAEADIIQAENPNPPHISDVISANEEPPVEPTEEMPEKSPDSAHQSSGLSRGLLLENSLKEWEFESTDTSETTKTRKFYVDDSGTLFYIPVNQGDEMKPRPVYLHPAENSDGGDMSEVFIYIDGDGGETQLPCNISNNNTVLADIKPLDGGGEISPVYVPRGCLISAAGNASDEGDYE